MEIIYRIIDKDKELFLFLNSKNATWLDPIMLALSSYIGWIVVFLVMLAIIFYAGGLWRKTASAFFILTVGASALITKIVKEIVARPRPIHNQAWEDMIHAIEKYETSYSFFSSHSATTFAMATFFFLFFKKKKIYGTIALLWAGIVAYSRIYLAKHFPMDIFCGILCGIIVGIIGYKLFEYYKSRSDRLKKE